MAGHSPTPQKEEMKQKISESTSKIEIISRADNPIKLCPSFKLKRKNNKKND
jgi:hypothetical protein